MVAKENAEEGAENPAAIAEKEYLKLYSFFI
jgi:hypothetical protein